MLQCIKMVFAVLVLNMRLCMCDMCMGSHTSEPIVKYKSTKQFFFAKPNLLNFFPVNCSILKCWCGKMHLATLVKTIFKMQCTVHLNRIVLK